MRVDACSVDIVVFGRVPVVICTLIRVGADHEKALAVPVLDGEKEDKDDKVDGEGHDNPPSVHLEVT